MSNRGLVVPADGRRMISTGVGIALVVTGSPRCGEASTGRRTVSYDGTSSAASDQPRPVFHPAGC